MNLCEDVEQAKKENNDLGIGRLYECVFCKRGFDTAQALGGHMNIHRRDRGRNKPNTSTNSNRREENEFGPRFSQQIPESSNDQPAHHHFVYHAHQPSLGYATHFPASTSSIKPSHGSYFCDQKQTENPLIVSDSWRMSLSLDCTPAILEDLETKRQVILSQKKELDLELRLGYDS